MTQGNVRPASMERITTPALAKQFIDEQIKELRAQIGDKRFCWRCPVVWIHQ